ncbi:MAG: KPN_02809 family neutral zinc metallopeptidase [Vicinamibacterales bacterium]
MKWTRGDRSNIEDRRGSRVAMGAGGVGVGGLLLLLVLSYATGVDFTSLAGGGGAPPPPIESAETGGPVATSPEEERMVDMVDAVMGDGQDTWRQLLGGRYQDTTAVLFRDATQSTCGFAQSATGPFYCPGDRKVYLDLGFFSELHSKLGAPGDFAQAYVLAHELGHHVQTVLGVESQVRQRQAMDPGSQNQLSVRMELQADCFAGVWGYHANRGQGRVQLETGDLEEGLNAAAAIGDDRLQRMQGGRVAPDRFTHGSSAQRVESFRRGLQSGDPNVCNTFQ